MKPDQTGIQNSDLPNPQVDPIEELIDDLAQQDYLPSPNDEIEVPPEPVTGGLDETGRWDEPIGERGHRSPIIAPNDEAVDAEKLVYEGVSEADEELRELDESDVEDENEDFENSEDTQTDIESLESGSAPEFP